jgi:hypothetical protein
VSIFDSLLDEFEKVVYPSYTLVTLVYHGEEHTDVKGQKQ